MNVLYECLGIRICIRSSVSFSGFGARSAAQALGISFRVRLRSDMLLDGINKVRWRKRCRIGKMMKKENVE